jgi:hypothetical protein
LVDSFRGSGPGQFDWVDGLPPSRPVIDELALVLLRVPRLRRRTLSCRPVGGPFLMIVTARAEGVFTMISALTETPQPCRQRRTLRLKCPELLFASAWSGRRQASYTLADE